MSDIDPNLIYTLTDAQETYVIASIVLKHPNKVVCIGFPKEKSTNPNSIAPKNRFALKFIKFNKSYDPEKLENEINIVHSLEEFPQFIKYGSPVRVDKRYDVCIPMNFYYYQDLYHFLTREGYGYTENLVRNIAFQGLTMLKILRDHNICHNDFKLENLIVKKTDPIELILIDFESSENLMENERTICHFFTRSYASPEVLDESPHDYAADVWSLGISIYYLLFGKKPFGIDDDDNDDSDEILNKIKTNPLVPISSVSLEAWQIIENLLIIDQDQRITAEEALKMEWFRNMASRNVKDKIQTISSNALINDTYVDA